MPKNPEVLGGLALLTAAIAALLVVNLGGGDLYHHLLETTVLTKSVHHWINDGLMTLFFLLVGIEIQREFRTGSLRSPKQAAVPLLAALGGAIVPAAIFLLLTRNNPDVNSGWSIPTATDIAFAIALITVLKNHVPPSLRAFLLALAVADDLLAIVIIALFYTTDVIWMNLFLAACGIAMVSVQNRVKIHNVWLYTAFGLFMWLCVLQSGVHATLAGVILGLLLPLKPYKKQTAPADIVEHALQPYVRWAILPLFAFANMGIDLTNLSPAALITPLTLAITMGLFFGKQLGVFGTVFALEKLFKLPRPKGANWQQLYGVACICGIGFTMSLFIGGLALGAEHQPEVRLAVLIGSLLSAALATFILKKQRA